MNRSVPRQYEKRYIGFIKIAFTHAFRHLRLGSNYQDAIAETLAGGGDTDTNACIVGGLVGAAIGVDDIPKSMHTAILNCDIILGKHPRQVDELIAQLLKQTKN